MFDLDTPFPATDSQNNQKQLQRYVSLTIYTKLNNSVYLISLHIIIFISLRGKYSRPAYTKSQQSIILFEIHYLIHAVQYATTAFENITICNNNFFPYFTSFYITRKCK